jgi:hypothetical protein
MVKEYNFLLGLLELLDRTRRRHYVPSSDIVSHPERPESSVTSLQKRRKDIVISERPVSESSRCRRNKS